MLLCNSMNVERNTWSSTCLWDITSRQRFSITKPFDFIYVLNVAPDYFDQLDNLLEIQHGAFCDLNWTFSSAAAWQLTVLYFVGVTLWKSTGEKITKIPEQKHLRNSHLARFYHRISHVQSYGCSGIFRARSWLVHCVTWSQRTELIGP